LRLRVRNKGSKSAEKCRAKLRVVSEGDDPSRYPSTDSKSLAWGRSPYKSDLSSEINIHPKLGEELLHVMFSDSRFGNVLITKAPTRYASVSAMDALQYDNIRVENSFTNGEFEIELVVTSEEASCKSQFKVHIDENHMALSRKKKPSRSERQILQIAAAQRRYLDAQINQMKRIL
jgi:hypothetical protein